MKPYDLNRWLATLIKPPSRVEGSKYGPTRLLVPYSGSGSEIAGALKAGWDEVDGIERTSKFIAIATSRIARWRADAKACAAVGRKMAAKKKIKIPKRSR